MCCVGERAEGLNFLASDAQILIEGSGQSRQVYLERFPELGGRQPASVSSNTSCHTPTWSKDGSLFFQEGGPPQALTRVTVGRNPDGTAVIGPNEP